MTLVIAGDTSPELVTSIAERESSYHALGVTTHMPFRQFPEGLEDAWLNSGGQECYTFPGTSRDMYEIINGAMELIYSGKVAEAIEYVRGRSVPSYDEKSEVEKWAHMTIQMPGDWGPNEPTDREHMRRTLTNAASGVVLEAMCGFTSYVDDAPHIEEVVAMDFCREGLERYDHPERTRILFDLETVCDGGEIEFLADHSVNTVVISFGVDYLSKPQNVYEELHRIITPGGSLLIAGGRIGYTSLLHQYFDPNNHAELLEASGFQPTVQPLPYGGQGNDAKFHLITAARPYSFQESLFSA